MRLVDGRKFEFRDVDYIGDLYVFTEDGEKKLAFYIVMKKGNDIFVAGPRNSGLISKERQLLNTAVKERAGSALRAHAAWVRRTREMLAEEAALREAG